MFLLKDLWRVLSLAAVCLIALMSPPVDAAAWIMRHGQTAADYQDMYDNQLPAGYRPISVNANGTTANPRFTTVWINDGVPASNWAARHDLTEAQYQAEVNALDLAGFRVIAVDTYGTYPNEQYVAAFVNDGTPDADWAARHRMTAAGLQTEYDNLEAAGLRMTWIAGDGSGSTKRFAGAWVRNYEGWTTDATWDLNGADYQAWIVNRCANGYRPICVTAYGDPSDPRFGAIVLRTDGNNFELQPEWVARHGQNGTAYQDFITDHENTDFQATCAVEYGDPGDPRYTHCWFEDLPAPVFSITGTAVTDLASLDAVMQDFMTTRKVPRGALAVTKDGRLVFSRAYTYAPPTEPLTQPGDQFRVASVAKSFTAIGIMQLVENTPLDLGDTIGSFPALAQFNWCDSSIPDRVTVRNLLEHSGGWDVKYDADEGDPNNVQKCAGSGAPTPVSYFDPMFSDFSIRDDLGASLPVTHFDIFSYASQFELVHPVGTRYSYSNFGYSILGRIIEIQSGQSYEDYIREHVFCPVGAQGMKMGHSLGEGRYPNEVDYSDPMRRCATSRFDGSTIVPVQYGGFNVENFDSHGGWIGSASQVVRVVNAFWDKANSPLLTEPSIDDMWAANSVTTGYGLGWSRRNESGVALRYHNGSIPGSWAYMVRRDDGVTWVALFNQRKCRHDVAVHGQRLADSHQSERRHDGNRGVGRPCMAEPQLLRCQPLRGL